MNILVTGSAGMIGGYVVKGLIEKGHTVLGIDRRMSDEKMPGFNQIILDLILIAYPDQFPENTHLNGLKFTDFFLDNRIAVHLFIPFYTLLPA